MQVVLATTVLAVEAEVSYSVQTSTLGTAVEMVITLPSVQVVVSVQVSVSYAGTPVSTTVVTHKTVVTGYEVV